MQSVVQSKPEKVVKSQLIAFPASGFDRAKSPMTEGAVKDHAIKRRKKNNTTRKWEKTWKDPKT